MHCPVERLSTPLMISPVSSSQLSQGVDPPLWQLWVGLVMEFGLGGVARMDWVMLRLVSPRSERNGYLVFIWVLLFYIVCIAS